MTTTPTNPGAAAVGDTLFSFTTDGGTSRATFTPASHTEAAEQARSQRAAQVAERGGVRVLDASDGGTYVTVNMATSVEAQAGAPITSASRNGFHIGNASQMRPTDVVSIAGIEMRLQDAEAVGLVTRGADGQYRAAGAPNDPK